MAETIYMVNENTFTRQWHLGAEIARPGVCVDSYALHSGICMPESGLLSAVAKIPGVTHVVISRYQITVTRGFCFAWDALIPAVVQVLSTFVPGGVEIFTED